MVGKQEVGSADTDLRRPACRLGFAAAPVLCRRTRVSDPRYGVLVQAQRAEWGESRRSHVRLHLCLLEPRALGTRLCPLRLTCVGGTDGDHNQTA